MTKVVQLRWLDEDLWRTVAIVADDRPDSAQFADLKESGHGSQSPPHELRVAEISDAEAASISPLHTVAEELYYSRYKRFPEY